MQDFTEQLRNTLQIALKAARAESPHPSRSFWYYRPDEGFPPSTIRSPEQYDGSECISIACTQTELPAKAQKNLVRLWCETLPGMSAVRYVWFQSKVPQELFEAACRMPRLEGLYVKWSSIASIEPLLEPTGLRYLHLGSSPAITDIRCLRRLKELRWLELDNLRDVSDLAAVEDLSQLQGFAFTGADGRGHAVSSLLPLARLTNLRWLHLGSLHVRDGSIRQLAPLKNLRWLGLGNYFPWADFAWLSGQLPDTACIWFKPGDDMSRLGIKCKKCGAGIVLLSGKGMGKLCPSCDAGKYQEFSAAFAAAVGGD